MDKFTLYLKLGLNSKSEIYKNIISSIHKVLNALSEKNYTESVIQFHVELRVDTDDYQWGDPKGVSRIKYLRKKEAVASSITLVDNDCETEKDVANFMYYYLLEAYELMIRRYEKEKKHIEGDRILEDFKEQWKTLMPSHLSDIEGNKEIAEESQEKEDHDDDLHYGIDKDYAHPKAIELIPDEFFWDGGNELSPFGSDEGYTALQEFRAWRMDNKESDVLPFLEWTIESVGDMKISEYSDDILQKDLIGKQMSDSDYDDQQFIYTLDISVIATGFGQLADEGKIDTNCKMFISRAINRQKIWASLSNSWEHKDEYIKRLDMLLNVLEKA